MNPRNVHFMNKIKKIPLKKQRLPLLFVGLVKNINVLFCPMIKNIPIRNNMLPLASKALSKNVIIPRIIKTVPMMVNPTPNFCDSDSHNISITS